MTWGKVAQYLLEKLPPKPKIRAWIDALPSSPDGELLGLCLAIDIASTALQPTVIGDLLDLIDVSTTDQRLAFHIAYEKHHDQRNLICASLLSCPRLKGDDHYIRIASVEAFITYFVNPSLPGYLPLSPSSRARIRRRYLGPAGGSLEAIDRWWGGRKGVTWVISASKFEELMGSQPLVEPATLVNDAAGLGHPLGAELMMIRYPKGFDAFLGVKQPTALDSDWEWPGNFFISFGRQDGWGRTHSCSGALPGIPERVHGEIKNPTAEYTTHALGAVAALEVNRSKLLREGYRRVQLMLDDNLKKGRWRNA